MGLEAPSEKTSVQVAEGITYAHRIVNALQRFSKKSAVRFKENGSWRDISYSELGELMRSFAAALRQYGIGEGDRVAIWLETCWQWLAADWAIQLLGATTVPIYHTLPAGQVSGILHDSGAKAIFSSNVRLESLQAQGIILKESLFCINLDGASVGVPWSNFMEIGQETNQKNPGYAEELFRPQTHPDQLSAIIYTSGTTGEPKGVMLNHRNVLSNMDMAINAFIPAKEQVIFLHLPMAHVVARNTSVPCALMTGNLLAIAEAQREKFVSNLIELAPTSFLTVPFLLDKFMARVQEEIAQKPKPLQVFIRRAIELGRQRSLAAIQGGPVKMAPPNIEFQLLDRFILKKIRALLGGRLQFMVIGGANSNRESIEFFWGIGIPVYEGYGSTEVTNTATFTYPNDMKIGTVGRPAKGMEVKLAEDGEVLIRGPNVMQGYWNRPEATKESIDPEGWFHSGDVGQFDEQGYLRIVDRKKEIFALATGKKVAPQAVENMLKRSAVINNVCVFGDKRNYMTALVVPELGIVKQRWGTEQDVDLKDPRLRELYIEELEKNMEELAEFERVKRFILIPEPFSVDNRLLSPILKLRRKPISERYRVEIDYLYSDAPPPEVISL